MKGIRLILLFNLVVISASAQRIHVGIFGGLAAYSGDLVDKVFPKKVTNGSLGVTLNYEVSDQFMIRTGFTYAIVGGADRFSKKEEARLRNLAFETPIAELSAVGEYYLLNLYVNRVSPYAFAGLAVFYFDPYAYNSSKQKTFLKPLSTEGQGISGYPDRKPYKLTQVAIPFGGGVKFAVTNNLRVGVEMGIRKLFTDYLDDVSKNYIDPADLLAAKGQLAVDLSYRGDEVAGGSPVYPDKIVQRGNPKTKDYYYFTGIHLTYNIRNDGMGGGAKRYGGKNRTGCPVNVY
jgi:opacity protein-like surface antigen